MYVLRCAVPVKPARAASRSVCEGMLQGGAPLQRRAADPSRGRRPLHVRIHVRRAMHARTQAIRSGPPWLKNTYADSPSSLRASDVERMGSGEGTLPLMCLGSLAHNYSYLCA